MSEYQLRYVAYATAHGNSPEEQDKVDLARYPGGPMVGYQSWIQNKWTEWREANGRKSTDFLSEEDHDSFNEFIGIGSNGR